MKFIYEIVTRVTIAGMRSIVHISFNKSLFFLCSPTRFIYENATRVAWVIVCILWIMTSQKILPVNESNFIEI